MTTRRMTVGQALVEFLAHQYTVDGDVRERTIPGIFGIFGHGNVAGLGQALKQYNVTDPTLLPYHQARNEQAMVHQAVGYARMHRRRATLAATASVGPGAANMLTGAALATANRMPALLLPSDTFATRVADPVLQQLELPHDSAFRSPTRSARCPGSSTGCSVQSSCTRSRWPRCACSPTRPRPARSRSRCRRTCRRRPSTYPWSSCGTASGTSAVRCPRSGR